MDERSFAGFTYQQRLAVGEFGAAYRGVGAGERPVRILEVSQELAAEHGFAPALTGLGAQLGLLEHRNIETTTLVGRSPEGRLIVVTQWVDGALHLDELLDRLAARGERLPGDVALAVAHSLVEALAHAHSVGLVHGGIHPRSVVLDRQGAVRLADFAVAHALAAAAADDHPDLIRPLKGYIAPELALGDEPSPGSDVYALGVLMHVLLTGQLPELPVSDGPLGPRAGFAALVRRAINTDAEQRIGDGAAFRGAFVRTLQEARMARATPRRVAEYVEAVVTARGSDELDDLLADLTVTPAPDGLDERTDERTDVRTDVRSPVAARHAGDPAVDDAALDSVMDSLVADLAGDDLAVPTSDDDEVTHTTVDDRVRLRRDPLEELIAANDAPTGQLRLGSEGDTPLPEPLAHHEVDKSQTLRGDELLRRRMRAAAVPKDERERRPAGPVPDLVIDPADLAPARPRGGNKIWILTSLLAVGGLVAVLYTQTDAFHPQRRKQREAERRAELERKQRELDQQAIKPGEVIIESSPGEAAVWVLLGRTPATSFALPSTMVHQLRLEHDGYRTLDVDVSPAQWTGGAGARQARVRLSLEPGADPAPVPAAPPAPPADGGGGAGSGTLTVESEPPGAHVWLLVGFTPDFSLKGIRAGGAYEFKLTKDGYTAGYVLIPESEWQLRGGGVRRSVQRSVELVALPSPPTRRPR